MADESDVEHALVGLITTALYPAGVDQPCRAGLFCKVFRGWPLSPDLETDLRASTAQVSVFSRNGVERVTTRYPREWQLLSIPVRTLTATVSGATVTIGGTVSVPQNVTVLVGRAVAVTHPVQAGDTLATIAGGLAARLTAQGLSAASVGAILTVPSGGLLQARVGAAGTSIRELRRQEKSFQITLWCPSPQSRDAVAKIVDPALAALNFIALADGSHGLIRYERTITSDAAERMGEYRRDLFYWIEYPTTETATHFEVTDFVLANQGGQSPAATPIVTTSA